MSQPDSTAPGATLGEKNLSTIHAVAQSLAIGPMFSVALILGGISRPDIGAGWMRCKAETLQRNLPCRAGMQGARPVHGRAFCFLRPQAGSGAVEPDDEAAR